MQAHVFASKKQANVELLYLYKKLLALQQSCLTQCLRFEKTDFFIQFEKNYSVPRVINLRLDDLIYLLLLGLLQVVFGVLPIDSNNSLTTPYRQSLALFFLTSFVALISPHWFRWLALLTFCIGYPVLIYVTINGYLNMMPLDTSVSIYNYMGYLSLGPIFILLVLIYPLRQFIRNSVGAIYSYVYGLAITLILYLWPFYSLIQEISNSGSITYAFITDNKALIIAFIVLAVTGFYFFIHHALFEPKLDKVRTLLLQDFTEGELVEIVEEEQQVKFEEASCVHENFLCFVRTMSFLIYSITLALQIFLYFKIINNTGSISTLALIMGYVIIFLLFGAFYIYIDVPPVIIMPFVAFISLGTAFPSLLYYNSSFEFYQYISISLSGPFIAVFWSIVKNISPKTLIFRTNAILALYITIFLPVMALMINTLKFFTTDTQTISVVNYILIVVIVISILFSLIFFIVTEVRKHKIQQKEQKAKIPVDYTYFQEGDPKYIPYQVSQQIGMAYLANIDLRDIGYVAVLIFFVFSEVVAVHGVNVLRIDHASTVFYSSSIQQIIISQFFIIVLFYIYTHCYLAIRDSQKMRYIFFLIFLIIAVVTLAIAFFVSSISTTLKCIGGFCTVMLFILVGIEAIKVYAQKIFGFISPIIVMALWIFIVLPYIVIIPFGSIFADQTDFGLYIYGCILGTVVLLILLVGILTLVFNRLIDKYEQEKKYKFVMSDVITLLQEEGIEHRDEEMHIFYESYMYRDKKYMFFMKRGFPLNLLKDPQDNVTKLVTSEAYALDKIPTEKLFDKEQKKKRSLLWACLTCCCGEDDEQIGQKIVKAKKLIDKQQLQSLLPKTVSSGLIQDAKERAIERQKKKWKKPGKMNSSKSLILRDLHSGPRYLGDQYILLKTGKNADLAIQIWHNIFDFVANNDQGQQMIISNDFQTFAQRVNIKLSSNQIDQIFYDTATRKWGQHDGMDLENFAMAIEIISDKIYNNEGQDAKFFLLMDTVFYNFAQYEQFNNFMIEKKTKDRVTKQQIKNSPFQSSYNKFKTFASNKGKDETQFIKKRNKINKQKQAALQKLEQRVVKKQEEVVIEKGPSCKRIIYDKIYACQNCCSSEQTRADFERKLFVRPWSVVSVEAVKIMEKKENDWQNVAQETEHPFRLTSNNILMAGIKFVDVFTYVSISIMNPQIGWISGLTSSNIYLGYSFQVFVAIGVVCISVPFGIKGIMLIFQDRLGLTENRLPAVFPHPMFFFVIFYKMIILVLFNLVSQTFLSTFNCNWTSPQPYTLIQDTSIECFSSYHTYMSIISLGCLLAYYPLSSYAMPNFQFAQKSLDLKFRPSYLILYFQVNFILLAGKVLLSGTSVHHNVQIIYNSINITALFVLGLSVIKMRPCFVIWFNWIQLGTILIGLIVNVMGFVLYMTGLWTICVIVTSSLCALLILVIIIYIKKRHFSRQVDDEQRMNEDQYKELELMWASKQKKQKFLISFQEPDGPRRKKAPFHAQIRQDSQEQNTEQLIRHI